MTTQVTVTKALQEKCMELTDENDKLRGLLAKGKGDCVYCQLPADQIAKCKSGFPGCARMDDIVNVVNTEVQNRQEERILDLLVERSRLQATIDAMQTVIENSDKIEDAVKAAKAAKEADL